MKLVDLNKDQDIGSNSLLVELGPFRIVVDAGIHPKKMGKEALPDLTKIAAASVDYIILTHCHLDHLGALPVVANHQPEAQILLTHPSSQIAPIMLGNSHTVMMHQKAEHFHNGFQPRQDSFSAHYSFGYWTISSPIFISDTR